MSSKNHYQQEENQADTPENTLANWNATSNALDGIVTQTATSLNRNFELLDYVEELVPEADKPYVQESKAITHTMAEQITRYEMARLAANVAVKEFYDRSRRLAGDYEELQNDVVEGNRNNPLVERLIDNVEEETYEFAADELREDNYGDYQEAFAEAYENVFQEIHDGISDVTGSHDWGAIYTLADVLTGNVPPTDRQKQLIADLLETCQKPEAADEPR